ncbi:hypothetical protein HUG17_1187 [Dermatophagoides farinae]|uniref:Uncharacterized protein n=1 Tax=Dermatophagoides farinae TaxID=6954 RepID=A0A9D4P8T3_DERFA|nr:hypothetical protein HUG17_1187 [Dermatophagoides farinae]
MLDRFLKLKECIPKALRAIRYEDSVSELEWLKIEQIVRVLKPFEIVIKKLSSKSNSHEFPIGSKASIGKLADILCNHLFPETSFKILFSKFSKS